MDIQKREFQEVDLFETSAVGLPAYGRAVTKSFNDAINKKAKEPEEPAKVAEPAKPAEPVKPVEPAKVPEPVKPVEPAKPAEDVTDKSSEANITKMVNEKFDSLVKSSSFEQIVEKQIKQILEKKSADENKPKPESNYKNETVGSLGAKFILGKN